MNTPFLSSTGLVLSVESGALRILVVKGGRVMSWMSYPLEADVFKDGLILSPAAFQTALSSLFFVRESIRGRISVCFPGNRSFFRTVSLPRFRSKVLAEAMEREAQRELPVNRDDVHLLWEPYGQSADRQDFLMVGMQKDAYGRLHGALKTAKIQPRMWDLRPLALVRAVSRKNVIVVDIAQGATEIIVVTGGVPRLVRSLVETSELAYAEQGEALAEHVSRTVSYYLDNTNEEGWEPKTPVVLTGPLASNLDLVQAFRGACEQPVEPFLCPLPCPPDFTPAMYAATLGVAMKSARSSWIGRSPADFEALGGVQRSTALPAKRAAAALALATGIAALAPAVHIARAQGQEKAYRQTELAALQGQLRETRTLLAERSALEARTDATLEVARNLEQERRSITSMNRAINADMIMVLYTAPPDMTITGYVSQDKALVVRGMTSNAGALLAYAQMLEDQGWFKNVAVTDIVAAPNGDDSQGASFVLSVSRT